MTLHNRAIASTLAALLLQACAHYSTETSYGMPQEVARRLVGSPMVETTTSTTVDGGFESTTWQGRRRSHTIGGFGADGSTVTRTHCVQAAEVDYVQPVHTEPVVAGRGLDVLGSVGLMLAGAAVYGAARAGYANDMDSYDFDVGTWNSRNDFYQMDPSFFPNPGPYPTQPEEPRGTYKVAAGIAVAGVAYLIYSLTKTPRGTPQAPARTERRFTSTEYVEGSGCGLVPAG